MPFCRSLIRPIATTAEEKIIVCTMIPGSRNSLYETSPGGWMEPPKT